MTITTQAATIPDAGWLADLTASEAEQLAGAILTVTSGVNTTTALLVKVEDGAAFLYRDDHPGLINYPVNGTHFTRLPGSPMRPALAAALDYQHDWALQRAALTDQAGDPLNQAAYDDALTAYEQDLPPVYDRLIAEYTRLLILPAA